LLVEDVTAERPEECLAYHYTSRDVRLSSKSLGASARMTSRILVSVVPALGNGMECTELMVPRTFPVIFRVSAPSYVTSAAVYPTAQEGYKSFVGSGIDQLGTQVGIVVLSQLCLAVRSTQSGVPGTFDICPGRTTPQ
jgi:hypothetical protein